MMTDREALAIGAARLSAEEATAFTRLSAIVTETQAQIDQERRDAQAGAVAPGFNRLAEYGPALRWHHDLAVTKRTIERLLEERQD